jgi:fatty acid desaturase
MRCRRSDLRTVAFVGFYYALVGVDWAVGWREGRLVVPLLLLTASMSWICAVIAHNILHCSLFRAPWANDVFQVVVTCAYGFPVSEYLPGHNLSHHRHLQKGADLMRTSKAPFLRVPFLNLVCYFPRVAFGIVTQNVRYIAAMRKRAPSWYRQLVREAFACWGTKALLLAIDWRKALVFVLLPHLWALYGITTANLLQHDGCDEDHPLNHSRNFVGRLFNWLTFNNGFHGAHHDQPSLHWSLLPAEHRARFQGRVAPSLEQRSVVLYFLRTFVFSARRQRHDGTPFGPVRAIPDEDWIRRRPATSSNGEDKESRASREVCS